MQRILVGLLVMVCGSAMLVSGCSKRESTAAKTEQTEAVNQVAATNGPAMNAQDVPPREGLIRTEHGWYDPRTHKLTPFADAPAPAAPAPNDWRTAESERLTDHVQLTDPAMFSRAGEAYFDPGMNWIIFQASPRSMMRNQEHAPYGMYVAQLQKETAKSGDERITGIKAPIHVSSAGSHCTCGFFHPAEPWRIMFGSTLVEPAEPEVAGYRRGESTYQWAFPKEMEVCSRIVQEIYDFYRTEPKLTSELDFLPWEYEPRPVFTHPGGYDAECAYSPDGRLIVYASIADGATDADLWIHDTTTGKSIKVVSAPGYDGGPFFSPDGKRLCYRSDRNNNSLLQVFVADLAFDGRGAITGIAKEHQVTANGDVNWAPYWHPSGEYLVYTTSQLGHDNYEVFAIQAPAVGASKAPETLRMKRVTEATGFDGLPVFSNDGAYLMWTSQRGGLYGDDAKPSSQVWAARVGQIAP